MPAGLDGHPEPLVTRERDVVLNGVADEILRRRLTTRPTLVAIDGIDGAGKSTFADEVARRLTQRGELVIRSTVDSFHRPRAERWRLGKSSPAGFYLDSHDLDAFATELLEPLRAGVGSNYRAAIFDEPSDQPVNTPLQQIFGTEIALIDGIFLQRQELAEYWDMTVFLDGKQRVDLDRLAYVLDGAPPGGNDLIAHTLEWVQRIDRYSSGMRWYLDTVDPAAAADVLIDNNNLARPIQLRPEVSRDGPTLG